jgi:hypothetical protein
MAISTKQAVLTIQARNQNKAAKMLVDALEPFDNARVTSLTMTRNWVTSFFGAVTLLAIVDHD